MSSVPEMVSRGLSTIIYNEDALEDFLYNADIYSYERFDGERWRVYKYRVYYDDGAFTINIECDEKTGSYEIIYHRSGGDNNRSVGVLSQEDANTLFRNIGAFIKGGKLSVIWDVSGVPDFLNVAVQEVADMIKNDPKSLINNAKDIYEINVFNVVTGKWEFDELVLELRFGLANIDVRIDRFLVAMITAWIPRSKNNREVRQVTYSTSDGTEKIFELLNLEIPRPYDDD